MEQIRNGNQKKSNLPQGLVQATGRGAHDLAQRTVHLSQEVLSFWTARGNQGCEGGMGN